MEAIAQFIANNAQTLTYGAQRDRVTFRHLVVAEEFASLMVQAGRTCHWLGLNSPGFTFIARQAEFDAFAANEYVG